MKKRVAILFGGRSTEHEISLLSAQNVFRSLDKELFLPVPVAIDKQGRWHHHEGLIELLEAEDPRKISMDKYAEPVLLSQNSGERVLISPGGVKEETSIDVIFPVLHGTFGEDGSVQGLAKLANIPCVGCGILGSAICMDKDIMKRILRDAGVPVARWETVKYNSGNISFRQLQDTLGTPLYIKPANLGSSVGISRVNNQEEFLKGLEMALAYDDKVLVEENITGREIECAVLGNADPRVSAPGEIIPRDGFYSYENKYMDEKGAVLMVPADMEAEQAERVRSLARKVYLLLECRGMARVDMFLQSDGNLVINEVNTIPGFTNISMYPKLWEYSGISQKELITKLIHLALEEHHRINSLKLK